MATQPPAPRKSFRWPGGWWRSLGSVLAGNALYFGIQSWLPEGAQHRPYQIDWGLAVDFWFCVAIYGLTLLVWPKRRK